MFLIVEKGRCQFDTLAVGRGRGFDVDVRSGQLSKRLEVDWRGKE